MATLITLPVDLASVTVFPHGQPACDGRAAALKNSSQNVGWFLSSHPNTHTIDTNLRLTAWARTAVTSVRSSTFKIHVQLCMAHDVMEMLLLCQTLKPQSSWSSAHHRSKGFTNTLHCNLAGATEECVRAKRKTSAGVLQRAWQEHACNKFIYAVQSYGIGHSWELSQRLSSSQQLYLEASQFLLGWPGKPRQQWSSRAGSLILHLPGCQLAEIRSYYLQNWYCLSVGHVCKAGFYLKPLSLIPTCTCWWATTMASIFERLVWVKCFFLNHKHH